MPSLEFGLCDLRVTVEIFLHADEKFAANPGKLRPHQSSFGVGGAFYTSRSGGLTGHAVSIGGGGGGFGGLGGGGFGGLDGSMGQPIAAMAAPAAALADTVERRDSVFSAGGVGSRIR